jgi:hypothetical protein
MSVSEIRYFPIISVRGSRGVTAPQDKKVSNPTRDSIPECDSIKQRPW